MRYQIDYSIKARKQIHKLPKNLQERVLYGLERIRIRPHAFVKKLVSSPYWSLRISNLRVILDISRGRLVIEVVEVDHRRKVYK